MDAFRLLTGGGGGAVKFDRQRFAKDLKVFQPRAAGEAHVPAAHNTAVASSKSKKKKKKAKKSTSGAAQPAPESADVSVYGASRGAGQLHSDDDSDEQDAAVEEELDSEQLEADMGGEHDKERAADLPAGGEQDGDGASALVGPLGLPLVDASLPRVHTNDPWEEANLIRKALKIKVGGTDVPGPLRSFAELHTRYKCSKQLLQRMVEQRFAQPTPIQRQAIPCLMQHRELLAIAPTGSGKTLAFLLPLIAGLRALKAAATSADSPAAAVDAWPAGVKALVLSPTRELAAQQARVLHHLLPGSGLRGCLLTAATESGTDFSRVDVLLANPLRALHVMERGRLSLEQCRYFVLDEADKLFEMGFMAQVDALLAEASHPDITRALFSATLPEKVEDLARTVLQQPVRITVGLKNAAVANVAQRLLFVGREAGKVLALRQLLAQGLAPPVLCFVATKERAQTLHTELMYEGVHVDSIHAGQPQAARNAAVENFRAGRTWLLIATDLIGRGMDFIGVNTVINYDFPHSTADYVHRIGRTGRAGRAGTAITFFTESDKGRLRPIAAQIRAAGGEVPDWMIALKKQRVRRDKATKLALLEEEEEEKTQQQQQRAGGSGKASTSASAGKQLQLSGGAAAKRGREESDSERDSDDDEEGGFDDDVGSGSEEDYGDGGSEDDGARNHKLKQKQKGGKQGRAGGAAGGRGKQKKVRTDGGGRQQQQPSEGKSALGLMNELARGPGFDRRMKAKRKAAQARKAGQSGGAK